MVKQIFKLSIISFAVCTSFPSFAAQPIHLQLHDMSTLNKFIPTQGFQASNHQQNGLQEIKKTVDANKTQHIRYQQLYGKYKVFGGEAILHINSGTKSLSDKNGLLIAIPKNNETVNGRLYEDLAKDLEPAPSIVYTDQQADIAMNKAITLFQEQTDVATKITDKEKELIVYVDRDNKAHWAYSISFYATAKNAIPSAPNYILDAVNFTVYEIANNVMSVDGGGYGGNPNIGKLVYDGLKGKDHLAKLNITRDDNASTCFLNNDEVRVVDYRTGGIAQFSCPTKNSEHGDVFWDGEYDTVNGGFSPNNDALYAGKVIKSMYKEWYQLEALVDKDGQPMLLRMITHSPNKTLSKDGKKPVPDNAYWDGNLQKMFFGDGEYLYPLTSLGVAAHEISHGFTQQHAKLFYAGPSGSLNESFSDLAAQAAEKYSFGESSWQIGQELMKNGEGPIRFMDEPTKDCGGDYNTPGVNCSINNVKDFKDEMVKGKRFVTNVHYGSGVYNKMFYTLAHQPNWDVKKVLQVMLRAQVYWTSHTTFEEAACGVMYATNDYGYDKTPVINAFDVVGIDARGCG